MSSSTSESSSTGSSSTGSSSTGSSSSSGCTGMCTWQFNPFSGQFDPVTMPCTGDCYCAESISGEDTPCQSIHSTESSSTSGYAADCVGPVADRALLRLPKFDDTNVWQFFPKTVSAPWTLFQSLTSGWMVTFLRISDGPAAEVTPRYLGIEDILPTDTAVTAGVILPEFGCNKQYWVTVQERFGWARLRTPAWDVTFIKRPSPHVQANDLLQP